MKCPRCLNQDKTYFYKGSKGWLCRRCIQFKRQLIEEEKIEINDEINQDSHEYTLKYPLTKAQIVISHQCLASLKQKRDVFIDAICGAGKTELVIESISYYLKHGKRVAFAIARRQVVLDLKKRLENIFVNAKVIAVCQGYTKDVVGDLILCTTHQLYRYPKAFDLLILDEPDAFPYKGNDVLAGIVQTSCKGEMIFLTATPDDYLKERLRRKNITHLKLNRRPHNYDLPVPRLRIAPTCILLLFLINWIVKNERSMLVFVPTIKLSKYLYVLLSSIVGAEVCTSKTVNKDEIIQAFKDKKFQCLIATTILERGVTIEGIDVCVFYANHGVFDEASLIQMSGRVGRSFKYPTGDCLFLSNAKSSIVDKCIRICKEANYHG